MLDTDRSSQAAGETMLSFVKRLFPEKSTPIGIELGATRIRLAQVDRLDREYRLLNADHAQVASGSFDSAGSTGPLFNDCIKPLIRTKGFIGRQIVVSLPMSWVHMRQFRMAKVDNAARVAAIASEAAGKLPIDPSHCMIRHIVAGEVYGEQNPQHEIIIMAVESALIESLLSDAERSGLEVVGVGIAPQSLASCFANLYRRKSDDDAVNLIVDIGHFTTRAIITRTSEIRFTRDISYGGTAIVKEIASVMKISQAQAMSARSQAEELLLNSPQNLGDQRSSAVEVHKSSDSLLQTATESAAGFLIDELELCRRYYEATFPDKPVTRLLFTGGEARDRHLCQSIARRMGLAAQVGDPFVRFHKASFPKLACIDRRRPQPDWANVIGLALSSVGVAV